jgi:hypothetical protein
MTHKLKELTDAKELSDDFWERVENEERWIDEAEKQAQAVSEARLYRPLLLNLEQLITDSAEKRFLVDSLQRQVAEEALEFEHADEHKASMKVCLINDINKIIIKHLASETTLKETGSRDLKNPRSPQKCRELC